MKIIVFDKDAVVDGFTVKSGFAGLLNDDIADDVHMVAATSGLFNEYGNEFFVYRVQENGEWKSSWETNNTFPVYRVIDMLNEYDDSKNLENAVALSNERVASGEKLHVSGIPIKVFDDDDYSEVYEPTKHPGVYNKSTDGRYTKDISSRYVALTESDFASLIEDVDVVNGSDGVLVYR